MTDGHFGTLSDAQVHALAAQLDRCPPSARTCQAGPSIEFWVQLPAGDGSVRRTRATRSWLRRSSGSASSGSRPCSTGHWVASGCSSAPGAGSAVSAAGGGRPVLLVRGCTVVCLAGLLADLHRRVADRGGHRRLGVGGACGRCRARRRTWVGLLGFLAIEAAVFVRYTDIAVLGCAVVGVLVVRWRRAASVPPGALRWWLGSVALFASGVAVFDYLIYGGPLRSGYRPGEVTFSLSAILPNLRYVPGYLIQACPCWCSGWRRWRGSPGGGCG